MDSTYVTFIERSDDGARAALEALRERLVASAGPSRLLADRSDPRRWLLVVDGDPDLSADERDGAHVWRFVQPRPGDVGRPSAGAPR